MYFLLLIFVSFFTTDAFSDVELPEPGSQFKCNQYTKLNIVKNKFQKVSWLEESTKTIQKRAFYISSTKEVSEGNLNSFNFLNNPMLTGEVLAFRKRVWHNLSIKTEPVVHGQFDQVVIIPLKSNCTEQMRLFIRNRFVNQSKISKIYKKESSAKSELFNLKSDEIFLFADNGYSYYFYPPNYISQFKDLKDGKKQFQQTIYLYSLVIDNDFKLKYPDKNNFADKFNLFFENLNNPYYEIEIDNFITGSCPLC